MTLAKLMETVERYTKEDYPDRSTRSFDYLGDATDIADTLTDPSPLTRERLINLGAFDGPIRDDVMIIPTRKKWCLAFFFLGGGILVKEREIIDGDPGGGWKAPLNPQPHTVGALMSLLMWMTLEQSK